MLKNIQPKMVKENVQYYFFSIYKIIGFFLYNITKGPSKLNLEFLKFLTSGTSSPALVDFIRDELKDLNDSQSNENLIISLEKVNKNKN